MKVYVEKRDVDYPDGRYDFAPSHKYPEYPWNDISPVENQVYDMVRTCLYGYGLDRERYGTSEWNPLGDIIRAGDTVVIKPNWVEDKNENKSCGLECVVTNAAIIRPIIDYTFLALKGTGRIIIGDSAMPDCDFDNLMKKGGFNTVWESCQMRNIQICVEDFREDVVTGFAKTVVKQEREYEAVVDLGRYSLFADSEHNIGKYRNGIIDATEMNSFYHQKGHHRYGINQTVLRADVIINLPKPKTHRKAGYTAALKNYIGICAVKQSIPHNVLGNVKEGGDSYYGPKVIFGTEQWIRDRENTLQMKGHKYTGTILKLSRTPFYLFRRIMHKKYFGTGNWFRNDTIWRAILDINRIMIYANKEGVLCDTPQRKFFSLGDMIVAGEKNGPLSPAAKKCGIILCSENPVAFDLAVVRIMGLNAKMLPVLNQIKKLNTYKMDDVQDDQVEILSNMDMFNEKKLCEVPEAVAGYFQPADGWSSISNKASYDKHTSCGE